MSGPKPDTSRHARAAVARLQDALAHTLGVTRGERAGVVGEMLASNARRAPGYWLQLFLAAGIATLGLVLGSTAVVIGGMLVSPLMGPIVELGMGFAVGSSLLVLRAFLRVVLGVAGVVGAAAVMTLMLPFREITPEIASRTAPTLLDLLIAVFCALAAAYTTVRQTADTTAAAAGTAIGIALVPPLCVTGFGLGTAAPEVAGGAALLFTANFSAILVVAVVSFLVLGFNRVNAASMEHDFLETPTTRTERVAQAVHLSLRGLFGSRYGLTMRLLVPATFLLAVYVPLKQALDEVAWEVRAREAVRGILAQQSASAMQTSLGIERDAITLRMLIIGSTEQALELERQLTARIAAAAGVVPAVAVTAVPDARSLATVAARTARPAADIPRRVDLLEVGDRIDAGLSAAWPSGAGRLIDWTLEVTRQDTARVKVRHLGPPLGRPAEQLLGQRLTEVVGTSVQVLDAALPAQAVTADGESDTLWLRRTIEILAEIPGAPRIVACVTGPIASRRLPPEAERTLALLQATPASRAGRLELSEGDRWTVRAAEETCSPPDTATVTSVSQ